MAKHRIKSKDHFAKKIAISALAVSLLSAGTIATVSSFTSSAQAPLTAKAGTVNLTALNSSATTTIDFGTGILPNGVAGAAQTVTVKNVGNLPLNFDIQTATNPAPGKFAEILDVTVTAGNNPSLQQKLNSIDTPLYALNAGATMTVTFVPKWTSSASDDTYQGTDGTTTLNFIAVQQ